MVLWLKESNKLHVIRGVINNSLIPFKDLTDLPSKFCKNPSDVGEPFSAPQCSSDALHAILATKASG